MKRSLAAVRLMLPGPVVAARSPAFAQTRRDARLLVTVVDQTGAVIPGATVRVDGQEPATRSVVTDDADVGSRHRGDPRARPRPLRRPGGVPRIRNQRRLGRSRPDGDNKQTLVLSIQKLTDEITVGRDKQDAAADARVTFGSALTREQIDAMSDDPTRCGVS